MLKISISILLLIISFGMSFAVNLPTSSEFPLNCTFDPITQEPDGVRHVWCNLTNSSGEPILNANISHSTFDTNDWYLNGLMDSKGWFIGYLDVPHAYNLSNNSFNIFSTKMIDLNRRAHIKYGPFTYPFPHINQTFSVLLRAGSEAQNLRIMLCNDTYSSQIFGLTPVNISRPLDYDGCVEAASINATEENISIFDWKWVTVDITNAYNLITENQTGVMSYSIHLANDDNNTVNPVGWTINDMWMPPYHNATKEAFLLNSSSFYENNESALIGGCGNYLRGINNTGNVLHLRFNELSGTIYDSSCLANSISVDNTAVMGAMGKFNNSFDFTFNRDRRVRVVDTNYLDLSLQGTLMTWVYLNSYTSSTNAGLIHKGESTTLNDEAYGLILQNAGNSLALRINNGITTSQLNSNYILSLGQWYHVAATWDGSEYKIYVDGELVDSMSSTVIPRSTTGRLMIGAMYDQNSGGTTRRLSVDGRLDEVNVFNRTLQENEIKAHYLKGSNVLLPDERVYLNPWDYNNLLSVSESVTFDSTTNYTLFNSNSDYLTPTNITSRKEMVNSSFTLCYFFKRDNINTGTYHIEKWGNSLDLRIISNDVRLTLTPTAPNNAQSISTPINLVADTEWHHVCAVRDKENEEIKILLDGEKVVSSFFNNSWELQDFNEVVIGRDIIGGGSDEGFQGILAQSFLHNDAHTSAEVAEGIDPSWWELALSNYIFENVYAIGDVINSTSINWYDEPSHTPISFVKIYNMNNESASMEYNETEQLYHYTYYTNQPQLLASQGASGVNFTTLFEYNETLNSTAYWHVAGESNATCTIDAYWNYPGKEGQFQLVRVNITTNSTIPLTKRNYYLCEEGQTYPNCQIYSGDTSTLHKRFTNYGNATVFCEVQNDFMSEPYVANDTLEIGCWSAYDTYNGTAQGIVLTSDLHVCSGYHQMISLNGNDDAVINNPGYKIIIPDNTTFDGGNVRENGTDGAWHQFIWNYNTSDKFILGKNITFQNGEIGMFFTTSIENTTYANIHFINMSIAFDIESINNVDFNILNNTFENCGINGQAPIYLQTSNVNIIGNNFSSLAPDAMANIECGGCSNITLEQNYYWDINNLRIYSNDTIRTIETEYANFTCEIGEFGLDYPYANYETENDSYLNGASLSGEIVDFYPCTTKEYVAPSFEIVSPIHTVYTTNDILLNVTNSTEISSIWYNWNGIETNETYTTPTSIPFNDGVYTLQVWVNDTENNIESETVTFTVDTIPPYVGIISPLNQIYNYTEIYFEIETSPDIDDVWYFNGTENISYNGPFNMELSEGTHLFETWANDSYNNVNYTNITFTITLPYVGCVDLMNESTYQGKVVNNSGYYYINENVTLCEDTYNIDVSSSISGAIVINSSDIYLDCNNSIINGTGASNGIYLKMKSRTAITGCTIQNYNSGIYLNLGFYNNITNNSISNNYNGIHLDSNSQFNNLVNNTVNNNENNGIYLTSSSQNTITNNTIFNNTENGIIMISSSTSTLNNNIINNNTNGIQIMFSTTNTINDNIVCSNTLIDIDDGSYSNNIWSNSTYDISDPDNYIYFDRTFWCNSTPFTLPLINVTLTAPEDEAIIETNETHLNYTVNIFGNCTVYHNISGSWSPDCSTNETTGDSCNVNSLSNGEYIWNVYCVDSTNETNYVWAEENNRTFTINVTEISFDEVNVTLISPSNGDVINTTSTILNYSVNIQSNCTVYHNISGTWSPDCSTNETTGDSCSVSPLSDGEYMWNVYCVDSTNASNYAWNEINWTFTVDTIPPYVEIISPENRTYGPGEIWINITNSSDTVSVEWYNGFTSSWILYTTPLTVEVTDDGSYILLVRANDTVGNYNYTDVTFTVDATGPTFTTIPADESIVYGNSWTGVTFVAEDVSLIDDYFVNDTDNFIINSSGYLNVTGQLAIGEYYVNVSVNDTFGNINSTIYNLNVTTSTSSCDVLFNETSPLDYSIDFIVYSNCDTDFTLLRNGTAITNGSVQSLGAGTYNFTVIRTDDENYTNIRDEKTFTINKIESVVYTYVNGVRGNITISNNTSIDINGTLIEGEGTLRLYKNNTVINDGESPLYNLTLFDVVGVYPITTRYGETENYTTNQETWYVNVTTESIEPVVELISPDEGATITTATYIFKFNVTAVNDISICKLIIDDSVIDTLTDVEKNVEQNISYNGLSNGNDVWYINCTDVIGTEVQSTEERNFTVNIPVPPSTGGSSSSSNKENPTFEYTWDCETGILEIETEEEIEVRLMNLRDYSTYKEESDSNGLVSFELLIDGTFRVFTESTSEYYPLQKDISLGFCDVEIPDENDDEIIIPEVNETEKNETSEDEFNSTEIEDLIELVESELEKAISENKEVSEAQDKLNEAIGAFENGNYELAEQLLNEALTLILNAEAQEPIIDDKPLEGNVTEPDEDEEEIVKGFDWLPYIAGIIVLLILLWFGFKYMKKQN